MMFAFQSLNGLLNVPNISTTMKYGMIHSSSLNSVKRVPDLDLVCNEITRAVQLMKHLKCEVLDVITNFKLDANTKNLERFCSEKLSLKLKTVKKISECHGIAAIESKNAILCAAADLHRDIEKLKQITDDEMNGRGYSWRTPSDSDGNGIAGDKWKSDRSSTRSRQEAKKMSSMVSRLNQSKNFPYQAIMRNCSLYSSLGNRLELARSENGPGQGQVRGFKTERRRRLEAQESSLYSLLSNVGVSLNSVKGEALAVNVAEGNAPAKMDNVVLSGDPSKAANPATLASSIVSRIKTVMQWFFLLIRILTFICLAGMIYKAYSSPFLLNSMGVGQLQPTKVDVTFNDARGLDEAKEELQYIVEFLRNPSKFSYLGGKLPSGVLIEGPPGTGKTLLAKAIAGEANVEFFQVCASEFDEYLVGEGARRVRNLFKSARSHAPAVIFIDEIDAVGGKRVNSSLHPYANQTINQLLAEMDGFVQNEGIVVIAATNRGGDLDRALIRPGRFDLKIQLQRPDIKGRKEILELYLNKIMSKNVDIDTLAKRTVGLSGADLQSIINQAALKAAISGCDSVTDEHLDFALEKVTLGLELKSKVFDHETMLRTAYHESGHTIVAFFTKDANMPLKTSIIPRGKTLGHTTLLNQADKPNLTKSEILANLDVQMGGRAAEELIYGSDNVSTGCKNDLNYATYLATEMVCSWGMSDKIGFRTRDTEYSSRSRNDDAGHIVNDEIDKEIRKLLTDSYERAKHILVAHAKEHKLLAEMLMEKETLEMDEIKSIITKGKIK